MTLYQVSIVHHFPASSGVGRFYIADYILYQALDLLHGLVFADRNPKKEMRSLLA